jgi:hypothetical protein
MKTLGTISLAVVFLLIAGSVSMYSQDREDSRPGQAQGEKDKDKGKANDKDKDRPVARPEGREQPGAERQEQKEQRHDERMDRNQEQRHDERMDRDQGQHRVAQKGKKIPDEKFRSNFGRQHIFKVQRTQVINVAQPTVVYAGYTFQLVDACPSAWGVEDPVFIDYDPVADQYFMNDEMHPDIRVGVFVAGGF